MLLAAACATGGPGSGAEQGSRPLDGLQLAQNDDESLSDEEFEDLFMGDDGLAIEEDFDPLETLNRFIFAINETLDIFIIRPVAGFYRFLVPEFLRDAIRNVLRNLEAPVIFANNVFQNNEPAVHNTLRRFLINTTLGLGGLIDVAEGMGYPYHSEDFGQSLGRNGVGPGPYIVLPIFGPSSLRDAVGRVVDSQLDPWPYVLDAADVDRKTEILLARKVVAGVDKRSRNIEFVDDLKRDSVDFYARVRSLYLQHRRSQIEDQGQGHGQGQDQENE